jgi:hypothetical protein
MSLTEVIDAQEETNTSFQNTIQVPVCHGRLDELEFSFKHATSACRAKKIFFITAKWAMRMKTAILQQN